VQVEKDEARYPASGAISSLLIVAVGLNLIFMSIESYRDNRRLGVTNRRTPTCFPASLEQVSPNHRYKPEIYRIQKDWLNWLYSIPKNLRDDYLPEEAKTLTNLVRPLGLDSWEDAVYKRANTPTGFARIAGKLLLDGYRVVADLTYGGPVKNGAHAVGLLPVGEEGHVCLVSNHVHNTLQGIVNLKKVGEHVALFEDKHFKEYPFTNTNIMALPPVD
jgi:hypothetical protein